ncbi:MAG: hypothetical protein KF850_15410 [Labilithrix sp.]|nr:hypothetical protein [Labilithrix sp.]
MRRLPTIAVLTAMALAGTLACSYILELPGASLIPDPEPDAADSDDADVPDGPSPFDGPRSVPFCASRTEPSLWCNDFDDEPAPPITSVGTVSLSDAQLVLSNAVALSTPRALLASVQDGTDAIAAVTYPLGVDPDGVTLSFDLLVSAWDTTDARLSQIELAGPTERCVVRLDGSASTWSLTQVCDAAGAETARESTASSSAIVRGRWQRFAIAVTFSPTPSVTLDVDGARTSAPGVAPLQRAPASATIGATLVPAGSVTLFQDNVLVTSP